MSNRIEVRDVKRRSPFDIKNHQVAEDPSKERRWVDPKRIDERKMDHFQFVKPKEGNGVKADGTIRTKGDMVLMERSMDVARERAKEKELLTRARTQSAKEVLRNRVEELSSQYGRNLHKYVTEEKD